MKSKIKKKMKNIPEEEGEEDEDCHLIPKDHQKENQDIESSTIFDQDAWLYNRSQTFYAFVVQTLALGMEYSLTFITLWMYLRDILKDEDNGYLVFFYSAISSIYLISQVVMSIIFGSLFDRFRNARLLLVIGNFLIIIGNVLYLIPFSPWYLFCGRLISGGGGCMRSIMTSEIVRVYPECELSRKFSFIGLAFALGFVCGPILNIPFAKLKFQMFGILITYANVPGLILAVVFLVVQVLIMIFVSNLSKEYDLKRESTEDEETHEKKPFLANEKDTIDASEESHETRSFLASEMDETSKMDSTSSKKKNDVKSRKHKDQVTLDHIEDTSFIEKKYNSKSKRTRALEQHGKESNIIELNNILGDKSPTTLEIFDMSSGKISSVDLFSFEVEDYDDEGAGDDDTEMTTFLFENHPQDHKKKDQGSLKTHQKKRLRNQRPLKDNKDQRNCNVISPQQSEDTQDNVFSIFKKMFLTPDVAFILFLSFFFMYCMVLFDLWLPMAATEFFNYGVMEINLINIGFGACAIAQLVLFTAAPVRKENLLYLGMFCLVGMIFDFSIFILLKYHHENTTLNIILLVIWDILAANVIAMEEIFLIVILAPKVSTRVQATAESIRLAFSRTGAVLALLSAASSFGHLTIASGVCVVLLVVSFVVLLVRRKHLNEETVLIK